MTVDLARRISRKIDKVGVTPIPANSGGMVLARGEVTGVVLKALVRNSGDVYVGGPNTKPYSGYGYCLEPGESFRVDVSNLDGVYVVACVSGDTVTWASVR